MIFNKSLKNTLRNPIELITYLDGLKSGNEGWGAQNSISRMVVWSVHSSFWMVGSKSFSFLTKN